jgi:sulfur carrier protein
MPETPTTSIAIVLNGEPYTLSAGTRIASLLETLNMKPSRVAVEINREVVAKAKYAETVVRAGDQVEIINFVGGG